MNYVYADESPYHPGKFMIRFNFNKLPLTSTNGSYNVLSARLLGLTYADYLRYCRDVCGAELVGKGCLYPVPYFQKGTKMESLIKLLNFNIEKIFEEEKENG